MPAPTGPITARITHYDYSFDIDSRASHAVLTAEVDVGGDCLTLPFRAQGLVAEEMKIDGKAMTKVTPAADLVELCGTGSLDVHLGDSSMASRFASFATYARVSSGKEPPARCSA